MTQSGAVARGRVIAIQERSARNSRPTLEITLRNLAGTSTHEVTADTQQQTAPKVGDLVEIQGDQLRVHTATLQDAATGKPLQWTRQILDPRRHHTIRTRTRVENLIRKYFLEKDFIETRTPLLVPSPGMEIHIRPFKLECGAYLPTSPEFAMKRLLVGGLERIFQIAPAFRYEPNSRTHHPEFTLLEWYRAWAGMEDIMDDTEKLFEFIALELSGKPELTFQGRTISVKTPWPRLSIRSLFQKHAGFDLASASTVERLREECKRLGIHAGPADTWDDLYFRIWLNEVESRLPEDQAVLVHHYPRSQAALSVIEKDSEGNEWAKRFEIYAGGVELGNAFEELTDAKEQRARFIRDMKEREAIYGDRFPPSPIDEEFLDALETGMPPSGGIAIGVDRMVMLFADEADIDYTQWLRPFPGTEPVPPAI